MTFVTRAALPAAVLVCGAILASSAPGFAQQQTGLPIAPVNALSASPVPNPAPEAVVQVLETAQLQPAIVQDDAQDVPAVALDAQADDEDFDSLAEAVAAQTAAADDSELRCLAAGVYFEAKSESLAGQLAVADVILNRTKSGRFPTSVCSVLKQPGQFSFVRGGAIPSGSGTQWKTAVAVAKVAQRDLWDSDAGSAMYFHARRVAPGWRMTKVAAIGNHVFYR
jgi:N-acetylmuramoyl-L-alanine amidase